MRLSVLVFLWLARSCSAQLGECSSSEREVCGTNFCDFPIFQRSSCSYAWPSSLGGGPIAFMCITSNVTGSCRACPPGWTASGAFCVECSSTKSCDRQGRALCDGACAAKRFPTCDAATKRVTCQECYVNDTALALGKRRLTRGGVLDAPDECDAYFQCEVGHYLTTRASDGQLTCEACQFPEPAQSGWVALSRGLTFGDRYSCLYNVSQAAPGSNQVGQYGTPVRSCAVGTTSRAGWGLNASDCVPCPNAPQFGGFSVEAPECVPVCNAGFERRGDACFRADATLVDCDADGYAVSDAGGACEPVALPWSAPGKEPVGAPLVAVQRRAEAWLGLDEHGDFRILRDTLKLARQGVADFCADIRSIIEPQGYVQDKPLFTAACGDVEMHSFYMLASGEKYIYAFLERSFGNNNRFVMWQVQRSAQVPALGNPGQVWQTLRLPGKVCSAVVSPGEQGDYVYLALCDAPMLLYVQQLDMMRTGADPENPSVEVERTQYVIGRRLRLLIGRDERGNRDGMRDQALFRGGLSVARTGQTNRLFVADYGNCRVAEVVIDFPGSFLTRVTTIGESACFSGAFPLPYPKTMTSLLGGAAAVFVTDAGLVQLDARMRRFTLLMTAEELAGAVGEPAWILAEQGGERLLLHNATHTAVVTRGQTDCPGRTRARRGATCKLCPSRTFTDGVTCTACSSPQCPANYTRVPCSDRSDARCVACPAVAVAYSFRFGPECEVVPTFPCPPGFFGLDGCLACESVQIRMLPGHGLCQCLGFPLGENGTCAIGAPEPPYPAWAEALRCTYLDANCSETGCRLASVSPRTCLPCVAGTYAADGLRCDSCAGFRRPSPARDACTCRPPSQMSAGGDTCVCPVGHAAGGEEGCAPCSPGTVKETPTELPDDYGPFTGGRCWFCLPGYEPDATASGCVPCGVGMYREGAMPRCEWCADLQSYAADAASSASCTACAAACAAGQAWEVCPVNASLFSCRSCEEASRYRQFVGEGEGCEWKCRVGFYEYNGDCFPCTKRRCEDGFVQTACSRYEDAHCRVPCKDATKPEENSRWGPDCTWRCEEKYLLKTKVFSGWVEHICVLPDDLTWSLGY